MFPVLLMKTLHFCCDRCMTDIWKEKIRKTLVRYFWKQKILSRNSDWEFKQWKADKRWIQQWSAWLSKPEKLDKIIKASKKANPKFPFTKETVSLTNKTKQKNVINYSTHINQMDHNNIIWISFTLLGSFSLSVKKWINERREYLIQFISSFFFIFFDILISKFQLKFCSRLNWLWNRL